MTNPGGEPAPLHQRWTCCQGYRVQPVPEVLPMTQSTSLFVGEALGDPA